MLELIVVLVIVAIAVFVAVRNIRRSLRGEESACSCSNTECTLKKDPGKFKVECGMNKDVTLRPESKENSSREEAQKDSVKHG